MSKWRVARTCLIVWAVLPVAGCRRQAQPLPVLGTVPEFRLTDEQGRPISRDDLRGKVWVADFIFTQCAGPCPRMSRRMSELQGVVAGGSVVLVSFSVDPTRDTPAVLREYGRMYNARPGLWRFVTGDEAAIHQLCRDGFKLSVEPAKSAEPISHSTYFNLVDREGRIRGVFDGDDPQAFKRLKDAIQRLLVE